MTPPETALAALQTVVGGCHPVSLAWLTWRCVAVGVDPGRVRLNRCCMSDRAVTSMPWKA